MGGSSEMEVINEIKGVAESLTYGFGIIVWKWMQINFIFFLVIKKVTRSIFVMRNFPVRAVKIFPD